MLLSLMVTCEHSPQVCISLPEHRQRASKTSGRLISPGASTDIFALYEKPRHVTSTDGHL